MIIKLANGEKYCVLGDRRALENLWNKVPFCGSEIDKIIISENLREAMKDHPIWTVILPMLKVKGVIEWVKVPETGIINIEYTYTPNPPAPITVIIKL